MASLQQMCLSLTFFVFLTNRLRLCRASTSSSQQLSTEEVTTTDSWESTLNPTSVTPSTNTAASTWEKTTERTNTVVSSARQSSILLNSLASSSPTVVSAPSTMPILSSTCPIPSISGGTAMASAGGTTFVISCFSGHNLQGTSILQCLNGAWDFPVPTCVRERPNEIQTHVHNKLDVNDIGMPTWLLYTLCAVIGLLGLLLLCCLFYVCLKICGCITEPLFGFSQVYPYGARRSCCTCCRERITNDDMEYVRGQRGRPLRKDTELTVSLPNETSGRNAPSRRHRSLSDSGLSSQPPESPETGRKILVKVRKKRAKSIPTWLPHSHPMRNINTSTK